MNCFEESVARLYINRHSVPATVEGGRKLGEMGGSGWKSLTAYPAHLHFEMKMLGEETPLYMVRRHCPGKMYNPGNGAKGYLKEDWTGYFDSPVDRFECGVRYLDPADLLYADRTEEVIVLEVLDEPSVRAVPERLPDHVNKLRPDTRIAAKVFVDNDGTRWYQASLGFPRNSKEKVLWLNKDGELEEVWLSQVLGDSTDGWLALSDPDTSQVLMEPVDPPYHLATVSSSCSDSSAPEPVLLYERAGGGEPLAKAWNGQTFVVVSQSDASGKHCSPCGVAHGRPVDKTWYEVYVGSVRSKDSHEGRAEPIQRAWICEDVVRVTEYP